MAETTITMDRTVDAPPDVVWDVITDHGLYAEAAPNLTSVDVLDGDGEGMVRRCIDTSGNAWTETCTRWEPNRAYAMTVDVTGSGFHRRLFKRFRGEWRIEPVEGAVRIEITFDFEPRYGPFGAVTAWYLRRRAPGVVEQIFDRWGAEIDSRAPVEPRRGGGDSQDGGAAR